MSEKEDTVIMSRETLDELIRKSTLPPPPKEFEDEDELDIEVLPWALR